MAEETAPVIVAAPAASTGSSTKRGRKPAAGPKKPKTVPTHPPTATMVNAAIQGLKERGGSSLSAIKKYLAANYKVDVEKLAPFVRKYLKSGVAGGKLVQTKGKGATGSFKLAAEDKKAKKATGTAKPKKAAVKKVGEKKPVKAAAKKAVKPKKVVKKKVATSAAKAAKKIGTVKAKAPKEKNANIPKVKAKTPKPKKASGAAKRAAPKKAASKK